MEDEDMLGKEDNTEKLVDEEAGRGAGAEAEAAAAEAKVMIGEDASETAAAAAAAAAVAAAMPVEEEPERKLLTKRCAHGWVPHFDAILKQATSNSPNLLLHSRLLELCGSKRPINANPDSKRDLARANMSESNEISISASVKFFEEAKN